MKLRLEPVVQTKEEQWDREWGMMGPQLYEASADYCIHLKIFKITQITQKYRYFD
jgi:hypothetical protein